jgi:glycosyltransferase involved in cell wall biosynthesis
MTISIVTPSYNQSNWLRLAVASVADQTETSFEHIVQDSLSHDGTEQWLPGDARVQAYFEKDAGMYDAINRGLRRSSGEICAYLNCDEQYLPRALSQVAAAFARNPRIDVLLAGTLVVDEKGRYICSRPPLKPSLRHLEAGRMYNLTSSIFFRARLFREQDLFFDPGLRIVGDRDWLHRVMKAGGRVATLNVFTSTFSDLGTNLALSAAAGAETSEGAKNFLGRLNSAGVVTSHRLRRLLAGHYFARPFDYSIYTLDSPDERRTFHVEKPTGVWRNRL